MIRPMLADLVSLLRECGTLTLQERGVEEDVLAGRRDVRLDELGWDSLGVMEFCIALEDRWGYSTTPEGLGAVGTLGDLARRLGR
jgi:acyl carrier protein